MATNFTPKKKKITGTKKNDKITWVSKKGWKSALTVNANNGNDVINFKKSSYNKNKLNGGNGKDTIYGGTKIDIIDGGAQDDKLFGYSGNDTIKGGSGNDQITGGKGSDQINGGTGKNTLYFSKGDGTDTVLNGKGTDTLVFKTETNIKNVKVVLSGNDAVVTYTGGKVILKNYKLGGHSANYIKVGKTTKAIADCFKVTTSYNGEICTVQGTPKSDIIKGNDEYKYLIYGNGGNDSITGGKKNDTIYGGDGNATIYGGEGVNTIITGTGKNTIYSSGLNHSSYDIIDVSQGTNTIIFNDFEHGGVIRGFSENDILQFNIPDDWDIYPDQPDNAELYDTKTKRLCLGNNDNYQYIYIDNYTNETANGLIKIGDSDAIRMSAFLENNNIYIYNDEVNTLSNINQAGRYYTMGGNDTITSVGSAMLFAGDGNDSITGVYGTYGQYVYVYGEDGDDKIETLVDDTYSAELFGGAGKDTIISHMVGASIYGDDGNDEISGGYCMRGGDGNDTITSHEVTTSWHDNSKIYGDAGDDEIHILDGHTIPVTYYFDYSGNEGNDIIYDNLKGQRTLNFNYAPSDFYSDSIRYYKEGNDLIINYINEATQNFDNSIRFKNFWSLSDEAKNNLTYYYSYDNRPTVISHIGTDNYEEITRTPSSVDISELTQYVAGWLSSGGSEYGSVNDALASNNETNITAIAAQFDNTNWQNLNP